MVKAQANVKEVKLTAKVIRADGTVENLGTIAEYKQKSFLKKIVSFFINK